MVHGRLVHGVFFLLLLWYDFCCCRHGVCFPLLLPWYVLVSAGALLCVFAAVALGRFFAVIALLCCLLPFPCCVFCYCCLGVLLLLLPLCAFCNRCLGVRFSDCCLDLLFADVALLCFLLPLHWCECLLLVPWCVLRC